jgi:hypothetical protein
MKYLLVSICLVVDVAEGAAFVGPAVRDALFDAERGFFCG